MRTFHTGGAAEIPRSDHSEVHRWSEGSCWRLISYDITQGLNGVYRPPGARVGWRQPARLQLWPSGRQVDLVEKVSATGTKSYEVFVRPQGEKAEKEAEALAMQYSFSRTASKTSRS